jgi:DNA polymerase-4
MAAVEGLFYRTCRRRVRLKGMRLVCGRLISGNRQMDLFSPEGEQAAHQETLQGALDRLRTTYGRDAVRWGRSFA